VETITYNGMLSGVSLSGDRFFYVNPLASKGDHHRQPWFDCPCCPPNVARYIASLPGRIYATSFGRRGGQGAQGAAIYVNHYAAGEAKINLPGVGGGEVTIEQVTQYPWNGNIVLRISSHVPNFALKLRIPGWCDPASVVLSRGPGAVDVKIEKGYATLPGPWNGQEVVELKLPMEPRRVHADPQVKDDAGKVAVARGPIVYCAESIDNDGRARGDLKLAGDDELRAEWREDMLGGVMIVRGPSLHLIPYYAWDNREKSGEMAVWIDEK